MAPQYIFNGNSPKPGENYRVALARNITGDFQFARAAVNYLWAYFFGQGIVDPPDTFDPARLDPDNPPPAPWTLQPSNARLLNALAQHFIDSGFNLKATMREIATSDTYQISSRYDGHWSAAYEPYFARKYVRRLWGEELHDAVVQSSAAAFPSYSVTGWTDLGLGKMTYAMQFPDVVNTEGDAPNAFLDSFLRGNRDDQPRKSEGSILQALNLMNSTIIESQLALTGASASQLMVQVLAMNNTDAVNRTVPDDSFALPLGRREGQGAGQPALGDRGAQRGDAGSGVVAVQQGRFRFQLLRGRGRHDQRTGNSQSMVPQRRLEP